jgi:hypothetical protein
MRRMGVCHCQASWAVASDEGQTFEKAGPTQEPDHEPGPERDHEPEHERGHRGVSAQRPPQP